MAMIYLVRHGQASFLNEDYDQLTDLGIQQSKLLGLALKQRGLKFSQTSLGSLKRHQQTSHNIDSDLNPITDSRWNEYDHKEILKVGNPEFRDISETRQLAKDQPNPMRAFQDLLNKAIVAWMNNEYDYNITWKAYKKASWDALLKVSTKLNKKDNAIIYTSGGPIANIVMQLLDLPDEKFVYFQNRIINTSITKVLIGKSGESLSTFNDYSHLEHNPHLITYR